jgi:dolichol-phosphate mannosyltransferase
MLALAADGAISFSRTPLRLVMFSGLLLGGLGLIGTASALGCWLAHGAAEAGWAVVLAVLLLIGGGILFALGVVGEYVGRIYEQVKARPLYVVKEAGNLSAVKREPLPVAA